MFNNITDKDIVDIIKEIKKDGLSDDINMAVIKAGGAKLRLELMKIINKSIEEDRVPLQWKTSTVIPIQ